MEKDAEVNGANLHGEGSGIGLDHPGLPPQKLPEWLRTTDACVLIGYSRPWVLELVHKGELIGQRSGYGKGKFFIQTQSILDYLKAHHVR